MLHLMQLLKEYMLRNTYCSEMANMPSVKQFVTFMIISEQIHTGKIYFNIHVHARISRGGRGGGGGGPPPPPPGLGV